MKKRKGQSRGDTFPFSLCVSASESRTVGVLGLYHKIRFSSLNNLKPILLLEALYSRWKIISAPFSGGKSAVPSYIPSREILPLFRKVANRNAELNYATVWHTYVSIMWINNPFSAQILLTSAALISCWACFSQHGVYFLFCQFSFMSHNMHLRRTQKRKSNERKPVGGSRK